ncbi:hypothetical protein TUM19329_18290 [Legionella antarctica]|uniref:Uncharacterized protein n=1 Tax=Legionella antarctica TaxID=2708020 RepID=A0A6F8T4Y3_9GAMM|nr:hypothetical protein [Legionella antarctica]BCA95468.1 hypothetical protein TUM19329_18290 [Legionella antarctica]
MVGFIPIALGLLGIFYAIASYADLIVEPRIEPGSTSFLSGPTSILVIVIVAGVIILLIVAYHMRRK